LQRKHARRRPREPRLAGPARAPDVLHARGAPSTRGTEPDRTQLIGQNDAAVSERRLVAVVDQYASTLETPGPPEMLLVLAPIAPARVAEPRRRSVCESMLLASIMSAQACAWGRGRAHDDRREIGKQRKIEQPERVVCWRSRAMFRVLASRPARSRRRAHLGAVDRRSSELDAARAAQKQTRMAAVRACPPPQMSDRRPI